MYTILFIETFLYVCGNSAILLNNIHSIYGKSTFLHFSEGLVHIVYNNDYMELQTNFSEFKEKGGTLSKIRYNKIVREKSQELIVNEIIPLLQR